MGIAEEAKIENISAVVLLIGRNVEVKNIDGDAYIVAENANIENITGTLYLISEKASIKNVSKMKAIYFPPKKSKEEHKPLWKNLMDVLFLFISVVFS